MAEEQAPQKEEAQDPGFDEAEEAFLTWKKNAPMLYDTLISHLLEWPSLSCQFFAKIEENKAKGVTRQALALGTATFNQAQNYLSIYTMNIPMTLDNHGGGRGHEAQGKPHLKCFQSERRIPHPGDINKLRICPSNQRIIATKSEDTHVYLWDCESADNKPIAILKENAAPGFALDWNCVGGVKLVSGDNKGNICLYSFDTNFEMRAEAVDPPHEPTNGHAPPTLQPTIKMSSSKFEGNGAAINDCRFQRHHGTIFGAVSDDCTVTLWDIRSKSNPFFRLVGHTHEIFSLDFAYQDEFLMLTCGSDNLVKLWDIRKVLQPIHEFQGHTDKVLRVEWNPNNETLFASCGEDRTVRIWDCSRIGNDVSNNDQMDGPPELLFTHSGHKGIVEDLCWNPSQDMGVLSVDAENLVQFWEIDERIYYDE